MKLALSSMFADFWLVLIRFCVNHHGDLNIQFQGNIWIHFRHESNLFNKFNLIFKSIIFKNGDSSNFCTSLLTSFENELTTKVSHWMWIRNCFKTYDFLGIQLIKGFEYCFQIGDWVKKYCFLRKEIRTRHCFTRVTSTQVGL